MTKINLTENSGLMSKAKMKNKIKYYAGIDVQISRGCCYYIIDQNKKYVVSGWIKENIPQTFSKLLLEISNNQPIQYRSELMHHECRLENYEPDILIEKLIRGLKKPNKALEENAK